jgi:hypothetical protein
MPILAGEVIMMMAFPLYGSLFLEDHPLPTTPFLYCNTRQAGILRSSFSTCFYFSERFNTVATNHTWPFVT